MAITARGVAIFSGVVLGAVAVFGLLLDRDGPWKQDFLLASWLPPIVLWPGAALATALDTAVPRTVKGQAASLGPAYAGLLLYGGVVGNWWFDVADQGTHENYASLLLIALMAVHAVVFIVGGGLLAVFPQTRPAGFQMWLAYPVLLGVWVLGSVLP